MSINYYIADLSKKVFYELGKGNWYLLNNDKEALSDKEYLALFIIEKCYNKTDNEESIDYITNRIAPDLFAIFHASDKNNISVVDEEDMTILRAKGYTCIGTRYCEPNSYAYQRRITYNNKHLNNWGYVRAPYDKIYLQKDYFKDWSKF